MHHSTLSLVLFVSAFAVSASAMDDHRVSDDPVVHGWASAFTNVPGVQYIRYGQGGGMNSRVQVDALLLRYPDGYECSTRYYPLTGELNDTALRTEVEDRVATWDAGNGGIDIHYVPSKGTLLERHSSTGSYFEINKSDPFKHPTDGTAAFLIAQALLQQDPPVSVDAAQNGYLVRVPSWSVELMLMPLELDTRLHLVSVSMRPKNGPGKVEWSYSQFRQVPGYPVLVPFRDSLIADSGRGLPPSTAVRQVLTFVVRNDIKDSEFEPEPGYTVGSKLKATHEELIPVASPASSVPSTESMTVDTRPVQHRNGIATWVWGVTLAALGAGGVGWWLGRRK